MPPMYIGGSGAGAGGGAPRSDPTLFAGGPITTGGRQFPKGPVFGGRPPIFSGGPITAGGSVSNLPGQLTVPNSAPSNTVGPQAVRPTGPSKGFDQSYLQNLATAIGGLFSRPQGSLSFNPLGDLSDIAGPGLGFGNAPPPGIPSTLLQDALNGLAFMFNQPAAAAPTGGGSPVAGGGTGPGRNRGGYPIYSQ